MLAARQKWRAAGCTKEHQAPYRYGDMIWRGSLENTRPRIARRDGRQFHDIISQCFASTTRDEDRALPTAHPKRCDLLLIPISALAAIGKDPQTLAH